MTHCSRGHLNPAIDAGEFQIELSCLANKQDHFALGSKHEFGKKGSNPALSDNLPDPRLLDALATFLKIIFSIISIRLLTYPHVLVFLLIGYGSLIEFCDGRWVQNFTSGVS
jgi:hypothetical protein